MSHVIAANANVHWLILPTHFWHNSAINSCVSQIYKQEHRQKTSSSKFVILLYSDTHSLTHVCMHACMHRRTETLITAAVFSSVISALISPCGRCTRGMIPLLRVLIGFWWLHWGDLSIGPPAKSPCHNDSVRSLIPLMSPQKTWCGNRVRLSVQIPQGSSSLFLSPNGFSLTSSLPSKIISRIIRWIRHSRVTLLCYSQLLMI